MRDLWGVEQDNPDLFWISDSLGEMEAFVPRFRHRGTPSINNFFLVYRQYGSVWWKIELCMPDRSPQALLVELRGKERAASGAIQNDIEPITGGDMTSQRIVFTYGLDLQPRRLYRDVLIRTFSRSQDADGLEAFASAEVYVGRDVCLGTLQGIIESAGHSFLGRKVA